MWLGISLYSEIYRPIFFKLDAMIGTTTLSILVSVWMTLAFKVTIAWEIMNFNVQFLRNFAVDLDEIHYVATTYSFVEAHAKSVLCK